MHIGPICQTFTWGGTHFSVAEGKGPRGRTQGVRRLIEAYRACWDAVIRGEAPLSGLDLFFSEPCFMVGADGAMRHYAAQEDVTAFNQTRLDAFRAGGVARARLRAVDVQDEGPHLSLAAVNWELVRADGSLERASRHYSTFRAGDPPRIIVSAFQAGS